MTGLTPRTLPERLRYLAAKLREGDEQRIAVTVALDATADELENEPVRYPDYTPEFFNGEWVWSAIPRDETAETGP